MREESIAYLVRHAFGYIALQYTTEALQLLPFLALGLLQDEEHGSPQFLSKTNTDRIVLDVGAHSGSFSADALRLMTRVDFELEDEVHMFREQQISKVVAVEPSPGMYKGLIKRAQQQGWNHKFCALDMAFSDVPKADVPFLPESIASLVLEPAERYEAFADPQRNADSEKQLPQVIRVRQSTIDVAFEEQLCGLGWHQEVFILKIDCEGLEDLVLRGAGELLKRGNVRFMLIEYGPKEWADRSYQAGGRHSPDVVLDELWVAGYGCFLILDRLLVPLNGGWFDKAYRSRAHGGYVNVHDMLCARPEDPLLATILNGFVTNRFASRARAIAFEAVEGWRRRERGHPTVGELHGRYLDALRSGQLYGRDRERSYHLGDLLLNGYGASPSADEIRESFRWLLKSAARGYPPALIDIGACYQFGTCRARNATLAVRWYMKAHFKYGSQLGAEMMRLVNEQSRHEHETP